MGAQVAVVVPAAGSGQRLGAGVPKALVPLAGEPILAHAVRCLVADPRVALIVIAAPAGLAEQMLEVARPAAAGVSVVVVPGGATRAESVARGLAQVPDDCRVVLVHDAARCLVPTEVVSRVVDEVLAGSVAVVPGVPVVDTIRQLDPGGGSRTVDRSRLRAVQTPQGFAADVLRLAHDRGDKGATDDAGMVEALGHPVVLVPGHPKAFKVTTAMDLVLAEALVAGAARELPPPEGPAGVDDRAFPAGAGDGEGPAGVPGAARPEPGQVSPARPAPGTSCGATR